MKSFRSEFHINQKSELQIKIEIMVIELDKLIMLKHNDAIYKVIFFKNSPPYFLSHLTPSPTPRQYLTHMSNTHI